MEIEKLKKRIIDLKIIDDPRELDEVNSKDKLSQLINYFKKRNIRKLLRSIESQHLKVETLSGRKSGMNVS